MMQSSLQTWLLAFRPRTLFLAAASMIVAAALALSQGVFRWPVFLLALITALLLQILANVANDYGDSRHGADNKERLGPKRAVQSGLISAKSMQRAMFALIVLTIFFGLSLLFVALGQGAWAWLLGFIILGGLAIWAAVAYTATDKPYGYVGLGDIMVLIFFGYAAVVGTYLLQAKSLVWDVFLPATSSGLLAVAVLNINNIRDIASDIKAGKYSLAVRLGERRAKIYHWALLTFAMLTAGIYVMEHAKSLLGLVFMLGMPLLVLNGIRVWKATTPKDLDPLLKQMSISSLIFSLFFLIALL
ncbi:MAG: 1,4-dihydroxy-2-naphthoate polyprenyltransferase [Deinococcales bacterium]